MLEADMAKRKYKKKAVSIRIGETAPKERNQHQGGLISEVIDRLPNGKAIMKRLRAMAECVLDAYLIREVISLIEYKAAMRFRKAYLRAVLHVKTHNTGVGHHGDFEHAALTPTESEQLLRQAYGVLDMSEKAVIIAVCGHDDWSGGAYRVKYLHSGLEKMVKLWGVS
jgi:hypothetical protein